MDSPAMLSPVDNGEQQRRLFVTLSNLSFLPGIFLALNWQHFHLVFIYLATMVCSVFYHWCDSSPLWPSSSDCIIQYDTLQFADFLLSGVSMWATLLTMAVIGQRFRLFCLTAAFITFAISIHSSRFHLATFIVPLVLASVVVVLSWFYRCRRFHAIYPPREDLIRMSVGVVFCVASGLLYLFQSSLTYEYAHGAWHIIVQLSACCLLPKPSPDHAKLGTPTSHADSEAFLVQAPKSWIVRYFPVFDATFWRRFGTRQFWRYQVDECCGVEQGPLIVSPRPASRSPPPQSPEPAMASPCGLNTSDEPIIRRTSPAAIAEIGSNQQSSENHL